MNNSKNKGFTLVEVLVVATIIGILLAMTGMFASKAFLRRAVDSVTGRVSNTLQATKLKAARNGVEYRTQFSLSGDQFTMITHYGDSNTDSTVWTTVGAAADDPDKSGVINISLDNTVVISSGFTSSFEFNPNGRGNSGSVVIFSTQDPDINRCGRVTVSTLGRISTVKGHWDGTNCIQVQD